MSSKAYDIAIIGGSLSARIAASLLAKQGSRVLLLRSREATASAWFPSSLFLEKLLGILGGRACFVAQRPIQVISRKARVTLGNDISLDDELRREFGDAAADTAKWLADLHVLGVALEELFWENKGLCWPSFKGVARFRLLCMRRRLAWKELDLSIGQDLARHPEPVRLFLTDLFQGLSLMRTGDLSRARAALLWSQALRPENIREPDFSQLLNKRFDQFHGSKSHLDDLEALTFDGSRWTGGRFKTGGHFTAATFLLGDSRWLDRFHAGKTRPLPQLQPLYACRTSDLTGQLSPLLESRVICGGNMPLRLAIEEQDQQTTGRLLSTAEMTEELLRRQLEPVLPFARFNISPDEDLVMALKTSNSAMLTHSLAEPQLRIGSNLYCADSATLLPEMGAAGAALLGWTLAEHLGVAGQKGGR